MDRPAAATVGYAWGRFGKMGETMEKNSAIMAASLENVAFDGREYLRNLSAHTAEELRPFEGRAVAWSLDGKRVLAHGATWEEMLAEADRLGLNGQFVAGGVPRLDAVDLGGATL
jgi:hypothetical protein